MEYTIFNLYTYFIIYSIAGWALESIYRSIRERKIINSGFLFGPFCPIYGIGAIIIILFFERFKENIFILFIVSFLVLSTWEYIVGVLLEKIFKTKYWDYSDHKININGRVCLFNSICWGILGVLFIEYINPFVERNVGMMNSLVLKIVIAIITILFLVDTIISIIATVNIKTALDKIEDLNNQIKEKIEEIKNSNTKEIKSDITQNMQNKIEDLKKKKNRLIRRLYRRVYRLKKAFPDIQSNEITEILAKKIILIKNKKKETKEEK